MAAPTFEDATVRTVQTLRSWLIVLSVGLVLTLGFGTVGFVRSLDETSSVQQVQGKQLRAGACLVSVIGDIHKLLAVPLTRTERRQQAHEPAAVRTALATLTHDSGTFSAIVRTYPESRGCR